MSDRDRSDSRAIRLSRLHAINWYGYQDTLPVSGNLVLAGVERSQHRLLARHAGGVFEAA